MTTSPKSGEPRADPDPLLGYRSNEEWQDLLAQFATLAEAVDEIDDVAARATVTALLRATDAIHREALHRLVRLFKDGVIEQVVTDPAIHTLMGMYDLLPRSDPACATVWDFLDAPLSEVGNAEVRSGISELPRWIALGSETAPPDNEAIVLTVEDRAVVVAQVSKGLFAVSAICPTHRMVMTGGALSGYSWVCPAGAGCVYDIRNGSRLGGGASLACYPVRVVDEAGILQIGFGMQFTPHLPAF